MEMLLFSVGSKVAKCHLESPLLSGEEAARLLVHRSIADGTPIYLDEETMMPVEPLCSWGRNMSYADLARSTLKDYGRIMARFAGHQEGRSRDVLAATESDLVAFKRFRTQMQERPIGSSAWGKESGLLDQFFGFAVDEGYLSQRPVRVAARGRNALAPRVRRGIYSASHARSVPLFPRCWAGRARAGLPGRPNFPWLGTAPKPRGL
ncbi:hypothetical protein ACFWPV_04665 [Streptomyces uncialis]|uniref:hypothetical protein n=1 Tax=Streptomyces uncialis TaxID=1048205 RepID=UPI003655D95E